jgi:hypothetical protein
VALWEFDCSVCCVQAKRPRRNRRSPALRAAFQETSITPANLVLPLFIHEGWWWATRKNKGWSVDENNCSLVLMCRWRGHSHWSYAWVLQAWVEAWASRRGTDLWPQFTRFSAMDYDTLAIRWFSCLRPLLFYTRYFSMYQVDTVRFVCCILLVDTPAGYIVFERKKEYKKIYIGIAVLKLKVWLSTRA